MDAAPGPKGRTSPWRVFLVFLRLGLTSFGGPVAHLAHFRQEFVEQRRWLGERAYADLVALCQFLPGPASSQVGMAIGMSRAGYLGAGAAWLGFTLPSAALLLALAVGLSEFGEGVPHTVIRGLGLVTVAVVAQAVWSMARSLCPDSPRRLLMVAAASYTLLVPTVWGQVSALIGGGLVGLLTQRTAEVEHEPLANSHGRRAAALLLGSFGLLLVGLPILASAVGQRWLLVVDAFYRTGALVFGGGHVVLPLLRAEVVDPGWVGIDTFLAGYGAAQAVPGPLFTFAAFLGASMEGSPTGLLGGLLALGAIFLPAALLVLGAMPLWESLRRLPHARAALWGVNAAVVGLLIAALYRPVSTDAITSVTDLALVGLALVALMRWKLPPWLVVVASGVMAPLLALLG